MMISSRPPQTLPMRVGNLLELGKRALGRGSKLDIDTVTNLAVVAAGRSGLGEPYYRDGLEALLAAGRNADLSPIGRRALRDVAWFSLSRRILIADAKQRNPELFTGALNPSFVIMGLPRSGTTHLHRLLAVDPQFHGVPMWELLRPVPPSLIDDAGPDTRRSLCVNELANAAKLRPAADDVHFADADTPEECSVLQLCDFHSAAYWAAFPVHEYAEWLMTEPVRSNAHAVYADYRQHLQLLQAVRPESGLALKAPEHTAWAEALIANVPEAMLLQTHRDPVAVIASFNSLVYRYQSMSAARLDPKAIGEQNVRLLRDALDRNLQARVQHPNVIHDVRFSDIVSRPVALIREIYERFNVVWPAGHDAALQEYIDANPRGRHGTHTYDLEDFGLTEFEVRTTFADYEELFDF